MCLRILHAKSLQSCPTLFNPMDQSPPGAFVHGIFQAKYTRVGFHALLQGIFLTQILNLHLLCLLHWQVGSFPLGSLGKPLMCQYKVINKFLLNTRASLMAQMVKNFPAMQETWVQSLGWKDPLEKGMATHSSILAWRTPWTEEPGRL